MQGTLIHARFGLRQGGLLLTLAMLLGACASQPNTYSQTDPTADFSRYRTYAFYDQPATDNAQYESLVTNFLKVSVAQQLDARGMNYDPENPDVVVNFFLNTKEKVRSRSVPTMSGYYGWRDPFYDPWPGYAYETRIDQYTEGTLNIDVADVAQRKLVWEGAIVGRITDEFVRNWSAALMRPCRRFSRSIRWKAFTGFATEALTTARNGQWRLARTPPEGWPLPEDFIFQEADLPAPGDGQCLTRTLYLSLDPYQWGRRRSGTEQPGDVCHGRTVSQVVASRTDDFAPGDFLFNTNGWQSYGLTGRDVDVFGYMFPRRLDPGLAPISTALGVMGMLGLTAYSGLIVQCEPQAGETVVVSAASGGVGQVAGQLAKLCGCRVVGITSTPEKCALVTGELGFDAAVSHLGEGLPERLARACPDGIDVYFENVGGPVFEAVLPLLNPRSRITVCGMISQYGNTDGRPAAEVWRATGQSVFDRQGVDVHGLFVGNFVADYQDQYLQQMAGWIRDGHIVYREDVWQGLAEAPEAFSAMLKGGNLGKTLVAVADDPTRDQAGGGFTTVRRERAG